MMKDSPKKIKVVAIAGATASGKTDYAIKLAEEINGEIISADSRLVYKGFDIATAKPSLRERSKIKHYLIDVVEPEVDYSVANFYDDAVNAINEIHEKAKIPVIAGGTGLYFKVLLEEYALPRIEPDYDYREYLGKKSSDELYSMLVERDAESAQKVHPNNKVRLIRLLEICNSIDVPLNEAIVQKENEYEVEWIGLNPPREVLYERINNRVDKMIDDGLVEETKFLLAKHGRIKNFIKTIGYQEILAYLDNEITLERAIELIKQNSRHYAKRQLTWFRRNIHLGID